MKVTGGLFCVFCLIAWSANAAELAPDQQEAIKNTIAHCLLEVHTHSDNFSKHFDAYYNQATGLVENNALYNGDQEPLYQFRKCMATSGFPLGTGK
jgi:uncharacterized protein with von Willebrand factor type A (vWA) domain